jgi:ABC-three component (ABC-3C) system Middle Component 3
VKPWLERPQVEATLLNPALLASLLSVAADSYEAKRNEPMIWPLAFLVPPLVLHGPTRDALPKTVATHLPTWIRRQPLVRAGFPQRAARLTPLTREGLRFGMKHGVLALEDGHLRGTLSPPGTDNELAHLLKSGALVGRWLAKLDQPSSAFALLGARP